MNAKELKAPFRIGNLFIPRYFDGSANNLTDDLSVKAWRKNIRPLVNKDFTKWAEMVDEEGSGIELNIAGKAATEAGLCPQAELMSFQIEAGQVNLKYRARVIGATQIEKRTYRLQGGLLIDEKEDYQEAQVGLDKSNKVDYVAPKYMGFFVTTDFLVETYDSHIDLLKNRLASLPPDEQIRVNEEIKQHKDWIKLINEQVAQVCTAQ